MKDFEFFDTADAALRVRRDKEGRICMSVVSDNEDNEVKVPVSDTSELADWLEDLAVTVREGRLKKKN